MTGIKSALYDFWSSFALDGKKVEAYAEDVLPAKDAALPYIIFKCEFSDAMRPMETAVTLWFNAKESGANRKRSALCDEIEKRIPPGGLLLPVITGGYIMIGRSSGTFISDYTPEIDGSVIGARVGTTTTNYTM